MSKVRPIDSHPLSPISLPLPTYLLYMDGRYFLLFATIRQFQLRKKTPPHSFHVVVMYTHTHTRIQKEYLNFSRRVFSLNWTSLSFKQVTLRALDVKLAFFTIPHVIEVIWNLLCLRLIWLNRPNRLGTLG